MHKRNRSIHNKVIWMSVLVLFVCVCCTTYVWAERMEYYQMDDSGAIALTPVNLTEEAVEKIEIVAEPLVSLSPEESSKRAVTRYIETIERIPTHPGIEISDDQVIWKSNTEVEIFKSSYVNGVNEITVNSDNGDSLIAPGTMNSYTFKLKNTGDVALKYTVNVDVFVSPSGIKIPVVARLNRYDGSWISGSADEYVDLSVLDGAEDSDLLSVNCYTYYTLDWMWPFENGQDEFDTWLGNHASDEDLTLTIVINTIAEATEDYFLQSGIKAPNTGDDSTLGVWIGCTVVSLVALIALILMKKKNEDDSEAEENE